MIARSNVQINFQEFATEVLVARRGTGDLLDFLLQPPTPQLFYAKISICLFMLILRFQFHLTLPC